MDKAKKIIEKYRSKIEMCENTKETAKESIDGYFKHKSENLLDQSIDILGRCDRDIEIYTEMIADIVSIVGQKNEKSCVLHAYYSNNCKNMNDDDISSAIYDVKSDAAKSFIDGLRTFRRLTGSGLHEAKYIIRTLRQEMIDAGEITEV